MTSVPARCATCAVRDEALCASLEDGELSALSDIGRRRIVPKGQVVVWAGDRSTVCANVVSGALKVTSATADGREQIVGLLFPGDFVGQPFVDEASLTVTALGDADLCLYSRQGFEHALEEHPRLERMLLRRTMHSLDDARSRMLTLGRKTAAEKVAGLLLDISGRVPRQPVGARGYSFQLPLGRAQMADVLGLTIETVSRQMTAMKAAGLIALPGGRAISILDPDGLAGRAEAA